MYVALLYLETVSFTILKRLSLYIRSVIFFLKFTLISGSKWKTESIQWKRFWHAETINTQCSIVVRKGPKNIGCTRWVVYQGAACLVLFFKADREKMELNVLKIFGVPRPLYCC